MDAFASLSPDLLHMLSNGLKMLLPDTLPHFHIFKVERSMIFIVLHLLKMEYLNPVLKLSKCNTNPNTTAAQKVWFWHTTNEVLSLHITNIAEEPFINFEIHIWLPDFIMGKNLFMIFLTCPFWADVFLYLTNNIIIPSLSILYRFE